MLEKDSKVKVQFKLLTFFVCVCGSPAAELWLQESPLFVAIGKIRTVNVQHYCNRNNCSKSKGVAHIADIAHIAHIAHKVRLDFSSILSLFFFSRHPSRGNSSLAMTQFLKMTS